MTTIHDQLCRCRACKPPLPGSPVAPSPRGFYLALIAIATAAMGIMILLGRN